MAFRSGPSKPILLHVLEDRFFRVKVDRDAHFLHIVRSQETFHDASETREVHKRLVHAVMPYLRFRVLVDLRLAKGNSSNDIELAIREIWFPVLVQFTHLAGLVATAAGRLQVTRMFREHGATGKGFLTLADALAHLGLPPNYPIS
jgi:hypothetical protein